MDIQYTAPPTIAKFMKYNSFFRLLRGPLASGKTIGCFFDVVKRIQEMKKISIASKWVFLAPTQPQVINCLLTQWLDRFSTVGTYNRSTQTFFYDHAGCQALIYFRAADEPESFNNLEVTGAFIDCADNCREETFGDVAGRVGRYPARGKDPFWFGVIANSRINNVVENNIRQHGGINLADAMIFTQPDAQHQDAENLINLPSDYYEKVAGSIGWDALR